MWRMDSSSPIMTQELPTTYHGIVNLPRPTQDERDPLRWPRYLKLAALAATAFVNFTANFAGSGLSVATPVLQAQFHKSASQVNSLLTFNFLLLGFGNMFWVPIANKYGKRMSLLTSTLLLFIVLVWSANETTFNGLLAARCLSGFVSAAGESIVPGIVSDLFFLHERAAMMSAYTGLTTCGTAVGPIIASFIIQYAQGGWATYMWVCAALAGANTVAIFLLYPESNFHRPMETEPPISLSNMRYINEGPEKANVERVADVSEQHVSIVRKPWFSIWKTFITIDHDSSLLSDILRPLSMLFRPSVLFAVFVYGTSLAAQIILIFAFPNLLMAPPYLFDGIGVGLMEVAAIIGFLIGCYVGGSLADRVTGHVIHRQGGTVYPEQRLVSLIPGCLIGPAGCILVAFACSEKLHWVAIAFGFGMVSFATVFAPNIAITYVIECYPDFATESLVSINVFKNLVAFLFLYTAVDWIDSRGWIQVYMVMFMLTTLGMLLAVPFYFFGRDWRRKP